MVSVELYNKLAYKQPKTLCCVRLKGTTLNPSPMFAITGLDPDKKYQIFVGFEQVEGLRTRTQFIEHGHGIAAGSMFMNKFICFETIKLTDKPENAKDRTILVKYGYKYRPVLKIYQCDESEKTLLEFPIDEASFVSVSYQTKKKLLDAEGKDNQNPDITKTHGQITLKLLNKSDYTELVECRLARKSYPMNPTPAFSVTGLDPEKKYQVFLNFTQVENVRKVSPSIKSLPEILNEPSVEHKLGIAFGSQFKETIQFEGLRCTNNCNSANDSTILLNNRHKYLPVLKIYQFEQKESGNWEKSPTDPLSFSFEEAAFETVTIFKKNAENIRNRKKQKRAAAREEKENPEKRQCTEPQPEAQSPEEADDEAECGETLLSSVPVALSVQTSLQALVQSEVERPILAKSSLPNQAQPQPDASRQAESDKSILKRSAAREDKENPEKPQCTDATFEAAQGQIEPIFPSNDRAQSPEEADDGSECVEPVQTPLQALIQSEAEGPLQDNLQIIVEDKKDQAPTLPSQTQPQPDASRQAESDNLIQKRLKTREDKENLEKRQCTKGQALPKFQSPEEAHDEAECLSVRAAPETSSVPTLLQAQIQSEVELQRPQQTITEDNKDQAPALPQPDASMQAESEDEAQDPVPGEADIQQQLPANVQVENGEPLIAQDAAQSQVDRLPFSMNNILQPSFNSLDQYRLPMLFPVPNLTQNFNFPLSLLNFMVPNLQMCPPPSQASSSYNPHSPSDQS